MGLVSQSARPPEIELWLTRRDKGTVELATAGLYGEGLHIAVRYENVHRDESWSRYTVCGIMGSKVKQVGAKGHVV